MLGSLAAVVKRRTDETEEIDAFFEISVGLCYYPRAYRRQVSSVSVKYLRATIISFSASITE